MATRTITYTTCDGCFRSTLDGIEIVSTKTVTQFCGPTKTIDICAGCDLADKYYCRFCQSVHSDADPCDAQLRAIEKRD